MKEVVIFWHNNQLKQAHGTSITSFTDEHNVDLWCTNPSSDLNGGNPFLRQTTGTHNFEQLVTPI